MSLLFISHSSKDNFQAVAIKDWLVAEGWNEIFLDLDPEHGIAGGEKWEQALLNAANRCDAVLYLISKSWLASEWCRWEFQLAQKLNKRLFILLIEEIPIAELPKELTESWQLVNLNAANDQVQTFNVQLPDSPDIQEVNFSVSGLSRLKTGLNKAGLDPSFFAWPPKNDPDRVPYRGLLALEADDAGIFFGRDAPIIDLMAQLRGLRELSAPRMMVVLGASGAGKSSFLRAGILPRLARDDRYFHVLPIIRPERAAIHGVNGLISCFVAALPSADRQYIESELAQGEDGLHRLFSAVISSAQLTDHDELQVAAPTLVLSIDQGEELFQAEGSHEANQLLNIIRFVLTQDNPQVIVLFTIRSDSYEYLQSAAPLEGVTQKTFSLPAMPRGSYQQVIEGPAKLLSKSNRPLKVTPQLTEQLLQDIEQGGARDALPLLAFTLEQLYLGYSDDGELSRDDYLQMGGIEGAIKSAVEHALQDAHLNPHIPQDRDACLALLKRGLIPWLAGIDPQTNLPRRRVALLSEIPEEARPLIQHFIAHRLLATDTNERGEITVEPAHEALLRQWTILKGWLEEDAAALSALETLRNACRDWEANLREEKWLLHQGGRLDDAEGLTELDAFSTAISQHETEYLKSCRRKENELKDKELQQVKNLAAAQKRIAEEAEQKTNALQQVAKRTKVGLFIAIFLMLCAIGLGFQVSVKNTLFIEQKSKAQLTASQFLSDAAEQLISNGQAAKAIEVAIAGLPVDYQEEDRPVLPRNLNALLKAHYANTKKSQYADLISDPVIARYSSDGSKIFVALENGDLISIDVETDRVSKSLLNDMYLPPSKNRALYRPRFDFIANTDYVLVAAKNSSDSEENRLIIVDMANMQLMFNQKIPYSAGFYLDPTPQSYAVSGNSKKLAVVTLHNQLMIFDIKSGLVEFEKGLPTEFVASSDWTAEPLSLAVDNTGATVAVSVKKRLDNTSFIWKPKTNELKELHTVDLITYEGDQISAMTFYQDLLVVGSRSGKIGIFNTKDNLLIHQYKVADQVLRIVPSHSEGVIAVFYQNIPRNKLFGAVEILRVQQSGKSIRMSRVARYDGYGYSDFTYCNKLGFGALVGHDSRIISLEQAESFSLSNVSVVSSISFSKDCASLLLVDLIREDNKDKGRLSQITVSPFLLNNTLTNNIFKEIYFDVNYHKKDTGINGESDLDMSDFGVVRTSAIVFFEESDRKLQFPKIGVVKQDNSKSNLLSFSKEAKIGQIYFANHGEKLIFSLTVDTKTSWLEWDWQNSADFNKLGFSYEIKNTLPLNSQPDILIHDVNNSLWRYDITNKSYTKIFGELTGEFEEADMSFDGRVLALTSQGIVTIWKWDLSHNTWRKFESKVPTPQQRQKRTAYNLRVSKDGRFATYLSTFGRFNRYRSYPVLIDLERDDGFVVFDFAFTYQSVLAIEFDDKNENLFVRDLAQNTFSFPIFRDYQRLNMKSLDKIRKLSPLTEIEKCKYNIHNECANNFNSTLE